MFGLLTTHQNGSSVAQTSEITMTGFSILTFNMNLSTFEELRISLNSNLWINKNFCNKIKSPNLKFSGSVGRVSAWIVWLSLYSFVYSFCMVFLGLTWELVYLLLFSYVLPKNVWFLCGFLVGFFVLLRSARPCGGCNASAAGGCRRISVRCPAM